MSPGSREQITAHLATCPHCAGFLGGAQSVRGHLQRDRDRYLARAKQRQRPLFNDGGRHCGSPRWCCGSVSLAAWRACSSQMA
ncbi:hypothetical protein HC891_07590 [Candidatus Gracilibacteria bacterium]|nr:hypothetical protein [Candidatus Gracilibacteria bacterium]